MPKRKGNGSPNSNLPEKWTKEQVEEVLRRIGLGPVLDEPPSEMSKYYVTNTFTEYGDPLAPFRKTFAPLANTDLRSELEKARAEGILGEDAEDAPSEASSADGPAHEEKG